MPPILRHLRNAVLVVLMGAVLLPGSAHASTTQMSIMMDDDLLVYRDDATRDAAMRNMKTLGVDTVRVTVLWSVLTDGLDFKPKNKKDKKRLQANMKRFKHFGEASPKAYPPLNWNRYDGLARACKTLGLICYFDLTGPGPSWSHAKPPAKYAKDAQWWKPNPRHFYNFVRAVGTRYSGKYRDNDEGRTILPRVSMWALWNEPNQGGWLRPQWLNGKPVSPSIYRQLYQFGYRALLRSGHPQLTPGKPGDIILAGETAPINVTRKTTTSAMGPKIFINELLCGPGSTGRGCSDFDKEGPIKAYAWAHHPYTKKNSPLQRDGDPQAITLANFGELGTQLDQLAAQTGHIAAGMPLISTEFGYETNPPDPFAATSLDQQAQYLELGDYLTSNNPRVIGNTQFLLKDVAPNKRYRKGSRNYWGTYQSGLYGSTGTPKPASRAYAFPFFAIPASHDPTTGAPIVNIWGQIRFRANVLSAAAPDSVSLQWRPAATSPWVAVTTIPVTNTVGYFTADGVALPGAGQVRLTWTGPQLPFNAETLTQPVS